MIRVALLLALAVPTAALASDAPTLDYTGGTIGGLMQQTRGIAYGLLVLSLVIALAVETFGGGKPRYAKVVMRFAFITLLLAYYPDVMTRVVSLSQSIARQLRVDDGFGEFTRAMDARNRRLQGTADAAAAEAAAHEETASLFSRLAAWNRGQASRSNNPVVVEGATAAAGSLDVKRANEEQLAAMARARESAATKSSLAGFVFDSLIALVVLFGHGVGWLMTLLSQVLAVTLYVLGPLALAFSVPAAFGVGGMWFRTWVTILSWPILQGLLFKIALAVGTESMRNPETDGSFRAVLVSLLTVAIGILTPLLARSFIGGALGNLASEGLAVAMGGMMLATRDLGRTAADFAKGVSKGGEAATRGAAAVSSTMRGAVGPHVAGLGAEGMHSTARAAREGVMNPPTPPPVSAPPSSPEPPAGPSAVPPVERAVAPAPSAPRTSSPGDGADRAPAGAAAVRPTVAAPFARPPVQRGEGTRVDRPSSDEESPK